VNLVAGHRPCSPLAAPGRTGSCLHLIRVPAPSGLAGAPQERQHSLALGAANGGMPLLPSQRVSKLRPSVADNPAPPPPCPVTEGRQT
jgi:hypothetical protein